MNLDDELEATRSKDGRAADRGAALHAALLRAQRQATYDYHYACSAWGSQDPATKLRAETLARIQARLAGGE